MRRTVHFKHCATESRLSTDYEIANFFSPPFAVYTTGEKPGHKGEYNDGLCPDLELSIHIRDLSPSMGQAFHWRLRGSAKAGGETGRRASSSHSTKSIITQLKQLITRSRKPVRA